MRPLIVCVVLGASLATAAAPPSSGAVLKLIDQLGDDDEDKRNDATKKLKALGESVLPALRKAARSHEDADVQLRAAALAMTIARRKIGEKLRFDGHTSDATRIVVLPDGKRALSIGEAPRLWDLKTGKNLYNNSHCSGLGLSVSSNGKRFASTSRNDVLVWDLESQKILVRAYPGHGDLVRVAALSPDGKTLFTGGDDTDVRFWDVDSGKPAAKPKKGKDYCRWAVWSPDGKSVAAAHFEKTDARHPGVLRLWDSKIGEPIWESKPHSMMITSVAFSTDGKRLVTGSADKTIRILDSSNGKELAVLKGHTTGVASVVFTPDGKRVVSAGGGDDRTVRVWDVSTKKQLWCLEGHDEDLYDVSVTPDGKHILSCSKDMSVRLWSMPR
jgi:WD40 repeat protein